MSRATSRRGRLRARSAPLAVATFGRAALLTFALLRALLRPRSWWRGTLAELHRQTCDALALVVALSAAGGALIAQQTGHQFQGTLPPWVVGSIVAASVVTEVTPLFVGFTLVGVVGARIAAELAAMQATEQVDALEVIGRDPWSTWSRRACWPVCSRVRS